MKLQYSCSSCKHPNTFTPKYPNRGQLQMHVGDEVNVNCKACGKMEKIHINKVHAVVDNRLILGGVVIGIVVAVALWQSFGLVSTVAGIIPIIIWGYENKLTRDFNNYRIRRR